MFLQPSLHLTFQVRLRIETQDNVVPIHKFLTSADTAFARPMTTAHLFQTQLTGELLNTNIVVVALILHNFILITRISMSTMTVQIGI